MKMHFLAAAVATAMLSSGAIAEQASVNFSVGANMASLEDAKKFDTFNVNIWDSQIVTKLELVCNAGRSKWLGLSRTDESCKVTGNGFVLKPDTKEQLPRVQYSGGFIIEDDGKTNASTLRVTYLPLGGFQGYSDQFGGRMVMMPENPSATAQEIGDMLISKVSGESGEVDIDDRIDSVELDKLFIPSAGIPSDKGCYWSGDMVYAYQTDSWLIKVKATCTDKAGEKTYELTGNMPWIDLDEEGNAQYNLVLTLPSAGAANDDALFVEATDDDLFASVAGISATINIKQSSFVTVDVDGVAEELASVVTADGVFTGTDVPLPVVRSLADFFAINVRTLFGA